MYDVYAEKLLRDLLRDEQYVALAMMGRGTYTLGFGHFSC
jgi:hypothetical protein